MNNLGIFMESVGMIDGSRGTLKSADRATTHGCLDWRSEAIFELKGLTLISLK